MSQTQILNISIRVVDAANTAVDLEGKINLQNSRGLRTTLFEKLRSTLRLALNMSRIRYIDSSGIATLIEVLKEARALQKDFVLFGLAPTVYEVLKMTKQLRYEMLGPVSLREATQALRDRQAESQKLKRAPMSFEEFAKSWEKTVLPMHKHSTRKHHAHTLKKHLIPLFGSTRIDNISRQQIQQWVAGLKGRSILQLPSTDTTPFSAQCSQKLWSGAISRTIPRRVFSCRSWSPSGKNGC